MRAEHKLQIDSDILFVSIARLHSVKCGTVVNILVLISVMSKCKVPKFAFSSEFDDSLKIEDNHIDIGLAENTGKTKYMKIGCNRGMIANAYINIGSNSYEKVKTFKLLGS